MTIESERERCTRDVSCVTLNTHIIGDWIFIDNICTMIDTTITLVCIVIWALCTMLQVCIVL